MTAVPVAASGSRTDIATARPIPRTPAHLAGGQTVRPLLDSPPFIVAPTCEAIKKNGKLCGAKLGTSYQQDIARCMGHMRFYQEGTEDDS